MINNQTFLPAYSKAVYLQKKDFDHKLKNNHARNSLITVLLFHELNFTQNTANIGTFNWDMSKSILSLAIFTLLADLRFEDLTIESTGKRSAYSPLYTLRGLAKEG